MFEIGWSELLLIGIVALIAIGPKELPTVLRTLGQWMSKLRRMASEFQSQFQEALREAEMADLKNRRDDEPGAELREFRSRQRGQTGVGKHAAADRDRDGRHRRRDHAEPAGRGGAQPSPAGAALPAAPAT
jgi:sec-independent protein translocase protein TatB